MRIMSKETEKIAEKLRFRRTFKEAAILFVITRCISFDWSFRLPLNGCSRSGESESESSRPKYRNRNCTQAQEGFRILCVCVCVCVGGGGGGGGEGGEGGQGYKFGPRIF